MSSLFKFYFKKIFLTYLLEVRIYCIYICIMAKKMVAFRFDKAFIAISKDRAESRNETFTDYVIKCVTLINRDSSLRKQLPK